MHSQEEHQSNTRSGYIPILWMYAEAESGKSQLITQLIPLKSIPLAITSVAIRTHVSPALKLSTAFSRCSIQWFSSYQVPIISYNLYMWREREMMCYLSRREIGMDDTDSDVFTFQFIVELLCSFFALHKDQYRWIQTLQPCRKKNCFTKIDFFFLCFMKNSKLNEN